MSDERGIQSADSCPGCGGRLLMRQGRDVNEGPDYTWRCTGTCGRWWTDDLRESRRPAKP